MGRSLFGVALHSSIWSIDTSVFEIQAPYLEPWECKNKKRSSHFFVTYQITISYGTLRITSIEGPFKGASQDSTVAKMSLLPRRLECGEKLHADAIYKNVDWCISPEGPFLTALQSEDQRIINARIHRARQSVERLIKRFKYDWKIFASPWRQSILQHELVVHVVAQLTNINLDFEPLDKE